MNVRTHGDVVGFGKRAIAAVVLGADREAQRCGANVYIDRHVAWDATKLVYERIMCAKDPHGSAGWILSLCGAEAIASLLRAWDIAPNPIHGVAGCVMQVTFDALDRNRLVLGMDDEGEQWLFDLSPWKEHEDPDDILKEVHV